MSVRSAGELAHRLAGRVVQYWPLPGPGWKPTDGFGELETVDGSAVPVSATCVAWGPWTEVSQAGRRTGLRRTGTIIAR